MRRLCLPVLLLLTACASGGAPREACWEAPPADDAPLAATEAGTLGVRELRRSRDAAVAATQQVELGTCVRPPLTTPDLRPLDDRERTERRLDPLIKK